MLSGRISGVTEFRDGYTNNVCSDWNPPDYGLLTSTQDATEEFYDDLQPSSVKVVTSAGNSDTASPEPDLLDYWNFPGDVSDITVAVRCIDNSGVDFAGLYGSVAEVPVIDVVAQVPFPVSSEDEVVEAIALIGEADSIPSLEALREHESPAVRKVVGDAIEVLR